MGSIVPLRNTKNHAHVQELRKKGGMSICADQEKHLSERPQRSTRLWAAASDGIPVCDPLIARLPTGLISRTVPGWQLWTLHH